MQQNKKDQQELKEERFKNIVRSLPIVLAEKPYDTDSHDY